MEVERTGCGGDNGVEAAGELCFEGMDGVKDEMLDPIWSELDVLKGLLSSDIHESGDVDAVMDAHAQEHVVIPETEGFKLLKLKEEEFAQHRGSGPSHGEMDGRTTSWDDMGYANDYLAVKDMPPNDTEAPYELALPANHGNLGLHGDNCPINEEQLSESQDKGSLGVDNANDSAEIGAQSREQFTLQSRQTEKGVSHWEELEPRLVGVDSVNNGSDRIVKLHALQDTQLPSKENEEISQELEQENAGTKIIMANQDEETGGKVSIGIKENGEVPQRLEQEMMGFGNAETKIIVANQVDNEEESDIEDSEIDDEENNSGRARTTADIPEQPKIGAEFISEMLRDGSLSVEGLASKGFVFMSDESESEEGSDDSSDDKEDEESDELSSIADSEEEDAKVTKSKVKTPRKEDSEETGPPRTKHELDVLPTVPKVTAVLEPHHKTHSVGRISSVLDLTVIVESSGTERVLNENSILWLTESRVPLGIVDEVFGPVKNPFYLVRFNEVSEIPENSKTGADVSYVSEFSEFVLKDNPSLYKRAVDASGLDDEELGSDEDVEFSDDEKEAAARMREKSKRALDNRENRQGQDWKSADVQHSKGQRTERGRGRGRSGGRGATTANAVDSAADFVAGMDLQGSPWHSQRPGNRQPNGRKGNRGWQNSPRNSGHQELQTMGSRTGLADGQMLSSQHQQSPQRRDGLYVAEQASNQMLAQQVNQAGGIQGVSFNVGAMPAHLRRHGIPTQQPTPGFQAFGYQQVPGYDAQLGIPRQGNFYSVPSGPQFVPNSVVYSNPNVPPNSYFNNQGQVQMNMIHPQGYGNIVQAGQMNFGVPVHRSLGDVQPIVHPFLTTFMGPAAVLGSGVVSHDHSAPYISQNSHNQGPVGTARPSFHGNRGHSSGRQQGNHLTNKGSRR